MTECPHCHREIEINEINYGTLFNCPLCNAVYFVGWDGQPEMPPTAEEMAAEIHIETAFAPIESSAHDAVIDNSSYELPQENQESYESIPSAHDETNDETSAEPPSELSPEESVIPEPIIEEDIPADNYDFSQPLGEPVASAPSTADQPGFEDVTEFANADVDSGPLTYEVRIAGIDSGKIYGELKEALTDSRFGWDVISLMKSIQNGSLVLKGLNPAKTFVLVNRIKYLPVQISWRQDVLSTP